MHYFKQQMAIVNKTIREIDSRLLMAVLYDALFIALSLVIIIGMLQWLSYESSKLTFLAQGYQNILGASETEAASYYGMAKLFLAKFIIAIALAILLPIVLFTISRYLIWGQLARKPFVRRNMWKFFGLQLFWLLLMALPLIIAIAPLYALAQIARTTAGQLNAPFLLVLLFWVIALLIIYFTHNLYYYFAQTNQVFESIKRTFVRGFKKLHYRALPGVIILLILVLWMYASGAISTLFGITPLSTGMKVITAIVLLITIFYAALARLYFYTSIQETEEA